MIDERPKVATRDIVARKRRGPKIVQVTCYDFPTAVLVDRAGVDIAMVLGLNFGSVHPTCVKEYEAVGEIAVGALRRFADEVRERRYPGPEHSYR